MARFRGSRGFVALGGIVAGTPLVMGARPQGSTTATFDGTTLTGVLLEGDRFTVAGDAQIYTIGADAVIGTPTPNRVAVSFTPAIVPVGGWADNAAVTFLANSLSQVREWEATPSRPVIDATCMGDAAQSALLDLPQWSGRVVAVFDYGDARHAALIDEANGNGDIGSIGLLLGYATGRHVYGHVAASRGRVRSQRGALVEVEFTFQGERALAFQEA